MRKGLIFLLVLSFGRFTVSACGWDWDTIEMEKQQFPTVHELITGKFLRHSQEFYYWRVKDRSEKLISYPDSLGLYDDLAWAYDKIGEHEKAIETMKRKDAISPGEYETYANLGTSYLHNGDMAEGLKYINKAIEINPEAHFGREVYQKYLVEYIISKQDVNGKFSLPLSTGKEPDFYTFLKKHHFENAYKNGSTKAIEVAKAVKGIAGMMKFSQHDSPILLEALGDLLYAAESGRDPGAGHLAARAYLKASFEIKDPEIIKIYEQKAMVSVEKIYSMEQRITREPNSNGENYIPVEPQRHVYPLKNLRAVLKIEILSADKWYEEIRQNELNWIKSGVNPDSAFAANYYDEPVQPYIYEANSAVFDKVDEEAWLNRQFKRPDDIRFIHKSNQLDDSTIALLDSIYELEFRNIYPEDTVSAKPSDNNSSSENGNTLNSMTLYILLGIVVVLIIVFVLLRKGNTRK